MFNSGETSVMMPCYYASTNPSHQLSQVGEVLPKWIQVIF